MADPTTVSVVIPAMNEAAAVGERRPRTGDGGPWREILVIDDGSSDDTGAEGRGAGARVIRHPYNKGNGAAVKSGIRASTGEHILIIDADGQHQPADALRLTSRLGEFDLVVGARSSATQAGSMRRWGNGAQLARRVSHRAGDPGPHSGFRAARRSCLLEFINLLPNGFSTPTTTTLCFIKAGYNVAFEPVEARQRTGASKIRLSSDGPKFLLIMLRIMTIFSPLRASFCRSPRRRFSLGAGYAVWTIVTQRHITNSSVLLIVLVGDRLSRRPGVRADRRRCASMAGGEAHGGHAGRPATGPWHGAAAARRLRAAACLRPLYWTGQPLTRDEREYLSLARSLAAGDGFVYDAEMLKGPLSRSAARRVIPCFSRLVGGRGA